MVRGSVRATVTVYFCLFYGTVVGTSDLSALEAAMETALQQAENGSHPIPGLAAQPDAAVAEQPWRPGDCMDCPGEPHALTLRFQCTFLKISRNFPKRFPPNLDMVHLRQATWCTANA